MKIAIAQIKPVKGNVSANIDIHKKFISLAFSHKADAIFFSELSLTGYEPKLAKGLSIIQDDQLLDIFQNISNKTMMTIGLGMPTKSDTEVQISMIFFQPNAPRQTYSKQLLHSNETPYFVNGEKQILLTVCNKKLAPAICYESLQITHTENAIKLGAEIYIASVAKSKNGIDKAMNHYPMIAKSFSIPVLMSNCVDFCDNFESAGQSAVWSKNGVLLGKLDNKTEGVLIFDTVTEEVITKTL